MFRKWCASILHAHWTLDHYPTRTRLNGNDDPATKWIAQILNWPGPGGLGSTPEAALADLSKNLETIRLNRPQMPRPGSHVPIEFAPSNRVQSDPDLYEHFREHILGFEWVMMTDSTSLNDFGDAEYVQQLGVKIQKVYGVDISKLPEPVVADIFEHIHETRKTKN